MHTCTRKDVSVQPHTTICFFVREPSRLASTISPTQYEIRPVRSIGSGVRSVSTSQRMLPIATDSPEGRVLTAGFMPVRQFEAC
jgi:hypothetical protein